MEALAAIVERHADAVVTEEARYQVVRETDLVMVVERHLTPVGQPDHPLIEHWRLEPEAPSTP